MANIILPESLRASLGPEMKMDAHWIDVRLTDGRVFRNIVVAGGRVITGQGFHPIDDGPLPFQASDIAEIRRCGLFPPFRWWFSRVRRAPRFPLAVPFALVILALGGLVIAHESLAFAVAVAISVAAILIGLMRR